MSLPAGAVVYADDWNRADPPRTGVRLRRAAVQSVPTGVTTPISWDTEDQDTGGFITVTGTTVTIPSGLGGVYAITYHATVTGLSTAGRAFGSINIASGDAGTPPFFRSLYNETEDRVYVGITLPLPDGAQVSADIFHSQSGSSRDVTAWMACYRIGV